MEVLKHECGIAMIRLRKPLQYYKEKIRDMVLRAQQAIFVDGETTQQRARRCRIGVYKT